MHVRTRAAQRLAHKARLGRGIGLGFVVVVGVVWAIRSGQSSVTRSADRLAHVNPFAAQSGGDVTPSLPQSRGVQKLPKAVHEPEPERLVVLHPSTPKFPAAPEAQAQPEPKGTPNSKPSPLHVLVLQSSPPICTGLDRNRLPPPDAKGADVSKPSSPSSPTVSRWTGIPEPKDSSSSCAQEGVDLQHWWGSRFRPVDEPLILNRRSFARRDIQELQKQPHVPPYGLQRVDNYALQRSLAAALQELPVATGRCAVVGNAGSLAGSKAGAEIDAHDFIIRMNAAHRANFTADVGNKTSLTLFNPDTKMEIEDGPNPYLFWTTRPTGYNWLERAFMHQGKLPRFDNIHSDSIPSWIGWPEGHPPPGLGHGVAILHPSFIHYVHRVWNENAGTRPSTGQIAVMFALHYCNGTVDVYGFDRTLEYSNQYHLMEDRSSLHDWEMETAVRGCLARASRIKFQPDTNAHVTTLAEDVQAYLELTGLDLRKHVNGSISS